MKPKPPNERLISIAAELVRGPNLDERFDLDDRLPKWAAANVERICDRQRELAIAVQDCTDKLMDRMRNLEAVAEAVRSYFLHGVEDDDWYMIVRERLAALEDDRSPRKPVSG